MYLAPPLFKGSLEIMGSCLLLGINVRPPNRCVSLSVTSYQLSHLFTSSSHLSFCLLSDASNGSDFSLGVYSWQGTDFSLFLQSFLAATATSPSKFFFDPSPATSGMFFVPCPPFSFRHLKLLALGFRNFCFVISREFGLLLLCHNR